MWSCMIGGMDVNPYESPHAVPNSDYEPTKDLAPLWRRFISLRTLLIVMAVVFPLAYWPMIEVGHTVDGRRVYEPNLDWPPLVYAVELSVWGAWKLIRSAAAR